jgi:SAM-dependent methyltransferase
MTLDAAQEAKLDLICRKLKIEPGMRLLDIGCGTARHVIHFARRGHCVVGADLSAHMIRVAREKARQASVPASLVRADMVDLPRLFQPGSFDYALCMFSTIGLVAGQEVYQPWSGAWICYRVAHVQHGGHVPVGMRRSRAIVRSMDRLAVTVGMPAWSDSSRRSCASTADRRARQIARNRASAADNRSLASGATDRARHPRLPAAPAPPRST